LEYNLREGFTLMALGFHYMNNNEDTHIYVEHTVTDLYIKLRYMINILNKLEKEEKTTGGSCQERTS